MLAGYLERKEAQLGGCSLTNEIDDTVRDTQGASSLDAAAELDDVCPQLARGQVNLGAVRVGAFELELEPGEVFPGQVDEAGADVLPHQVLALLVRALGRHLYLELAGAEGEIQDGLAALGLAGLGGRLAAHAPRARQTAHAGIVLLYLVEAGDAEVDPALAHEGRDVGSGEKDQGNREVLDERDVEAVLTPELDVGSLEEV